MGKRKKLFMIFGVLIGLFGCSRSGSNQKLSANTEDNTASNANEPMGSVHSPGCSSPLVAKITMINPGDGKVEVSRNVTWEVTATGCTGNYSMLTPGASSPTVFHSSLRFNQNYATAGVMTEQVKISAVLGGSGDVVATIRLSSSFTVTNPSSNNVSTSPSPTPIAPPRCQLIRRGFPSQMSPGIPFEMQVYGSFNQAYINDVLLPSTLQIKVLPNFAGAYLLTGVVVGPGGSGLCKADYTPPACTLKVASIKNGETVLHMAIVGRVLSASVDGKSQALPHPPSNTISYKRMNTGVENLTIYGEVRGAEGEQAICSVSFKTCGVENVKTYNLSGKNEPLPDCGTGAFCDPSGEWVSGQGLSPLVIATGLSAGDRFRIENLTGIFSVGWNIDCLKGGNVTVPTHFPVVQFTNDLNKVQVPGIATPSNRNAVLLRDLRSWYTVAKNIKRAYAGVTDSYHKDNGGKCSFQVRVIPECVR